MFTQGSVYLMVSTDIPHVEFDVHVLHSLHIEADGWCGAQSLSQLPLV